MTNIVIVSDVDFVQNGVAITLTAGEVLNADDIGHRPWSWYDVTDKEPTATIKGDELVPLTTTDPVASTPDAIGDESDNQTSKNPDDENEDTANADIVERRAFLSAQGVNVSSKRKHETIIKKSDELGFGADA